MLLSFDHAEKWVLALSRLPVNNYSNEGRVHCKLERGPNLQRTKREKNTLPFRKYIAQGLGILLKDASSSKGRMVLSSKEKFHFAELLTPWKRTANPDLE